MISAQEWLSLENFTPADIPDSDKMQFSIIKALDLFTNRVGLKPVFHDTWRPAQAGAPVWHNSGIAVDVSYPGRDPLAILQEAESSNLFDGVGIYRNEAGGVSFHFDKRGYKARWGAEITRVVDPDTGKTVQKNAYTTLENIVALLTKKKVILTGGGLVVILVGLLLLLKKR